MKAGWDLADARVPHVAFVVPGSIDTLTGGYGYDRRIVQGLRQRGWIVDLRELATTFPFPPPADIDRAVETFASFPDRTIVIVDGLAFGAMPEVVRPETSRLRLVALVHHPLADETGLEVAAIRAFTTSERSALTAARAVVVTSPRTARRLAAFEVPADRILIVEPGTDSAPLARGSGGSGVSMLSVATFTPRKGHHVLLAALARLQHRDWHLTCVGSLDRDSGHVATLGALIDAGDLTSRVTLAGELDVAGLAPLYDRSDLFVLPTLYEGYGMVVAEALARGLPVVSTATGAIPELLGEGAGLALAPGAVDALHAALERLLGDPAALAAMAAGARRMRERLPTWEAQAARMADVIERVGADVL
jgi:glycosyltransferase involved in cell wall biosynthesis